MGLFCDDKDILIWEPAVFNEPAVAHLALVRAVDATLAGTTLTTAAVLGPIEAGMVALLSQGTGDTLVTTAAEIVAVAAVDQASVSVLRRASDDPAVAPVLQGAMKLTVVSLRPVIEAIGGELTALLGVPATVSDFSAVMGLKAAAIFGTLAAIYRAAGPSTAADRKLALYTRLYQVARRAVAGFVDLDGDGAPESSVAAGVTTMERS